MNEYLLTFELDEDAEQISVHGDAAGLEYFARQLLGIAAKIKLGEVSHEHYFTSEWGGNELSSKKQSNRDSLINHVKVYGWSSLGVTKSCEET